MAKLVIDCRKLACPEPVILTMKAMKEAEEVVAIVDNDAARENVGQLGRNEGWSVATESKPDGTYVTLKKVVGTAPLPKPVEEKAAPARGVVVLVASEYLGRGELPQLGSLLMQSFLHTMNGLLTKPETVIFINSGVKLVGSGSPVVEDLKKLREDGVELLACGTCLSQFQLMDKVAVGQVSNMAVIADTLLRAEKGISL